MEQIKIMEYSRVLRHYQDQDLEAGVDAVIEEYCPGEKGRPWFPAPAVVMRYVQRAARTRVNQGGPSLIQLPNDRDPMTPERFDRSLEKAPPWLQEKMEKLKEEMDWK